MKRVKILVLAPVLSSVVFAWGFAMGRYELFPFPLIQKIKLMVFPFEPKKAFSVVENPAWQSDVTHFRSLSFSPQIVMLGDSITASGEWHEIFPEKKIINRGIGGDTVAGILKRLDEVKDKKPQSVFVLAGVNDFRDGRDVDLVFRDYKKVLDGLSGAGITVVVQSTIVPGMNVDTKLRQNVQDLNSALRDYCRSQNILFVDLNASLAEGGALRPEFTFGGIHLNGLGYKAWSQILLKYI